MNMKSRNTLQSALCYGVICTVSLGALGTAHAQRDRGDRTQQRQERRDRIQNMTPEQRQQLQQQRGQGQGQGQGQNRPGGQNFQNMTPEQRQQFAEQRAKRQEEEKAQWIRQAMASSTFTDKTLQDTVIAFISDQEKARKPLQEKAHALSTDLIKPETTDEAFKTSLAAFRQSVTDYKTQYDSDLAALDAKIEFSKKPRLETLLTALGVVGYEVPTIGGVGTVFPESPMGNQGGRPGGGRGGQGGQAGGRGGGQGGRPGGDRGGPPAPGEGAPPAE
jgi:hypothetical protein